MTAFYNEYDPKAAAWLRELIAQGHIAPGIVDERSILDVKPADLAGYTQCHFFAGIGGWSLALRFAGWPDDRPVWTGSPPCQPFSAAGRQLGQADERHLAPHFASLVAACQPVRLFGEQVASAAVFGKATGRSGKSVEGQAPLEWAWLDDLFERLEAAYYACGASDIPAAGVGAAHIRQRTFFGAQRLDDPASPRHHGSFAGSEGLARDEAWLRLSGAGSGPVGLADNAGERLEARRCEPGLERGSVERPERLCDDGGLADADDTGSQGRPGVSERADERLAGPGGLGGGMADPLHAGRPEWRPVAGGGSVAGGGGGTGGVADPDYAERRANTARGHDGGGHDTGRQEGSGHVEGRGGNGGADAADSQRRDADWLFCRDGKWRPVEPCTFPLAHGVSARVGRLRGYGNAIVPQAAAEFIKAFDAASAECFRLNDLSEMTTDKGVFG